MTKNTTIVVVVAVLLVIVLVVVGYIKKTPTTEPTTPEDEMANEMPEQEPEESMPEEQPEYESPEHMAPSVQDIKPADKVENATFLLSEKLVTLTDGKYEMPIENSAAKEMVSIYEKKNGDLNNDNKDDAALVLVQTTGGSGTFYYIAATITQADDMVKGTNTIPLGDRITLKSLDIVDGEIIVNYTERTLEGEEEKQVTRYFRVNENGVLTEMESAGD